MYKRPVYNQLLSRLKEPRRFIQILAGPRQVGKTTISKQIVGSDVIKAHYASADEPTLKDSSWIREQWEITRVLAKENKSEMGVLLILDEVQKLPKWSEVVKKMWDQDTWDKANIKVILLGSSTLLIQDGLTESLALIPVCHWSFTECMDAFGLSVEQFIYFGGYPVVASLIQDEQRWSQYIIDSIIETSISRDIMLMTRVNKPALLRRLFELGCRYSGQILSYQKMLGQLQDTGNATTLAHYLDLLCGAGMIAGLEKFTQAAVRQKASSPKLQVFNTALMTAQGSQSFFSAQTNREEWGRFVESAIGAHLINTTRGTKIKVFYWREGNMEVDFVLSNGSDVVAIEVKSGKKITNFSGMKVFTERFGPKRILVVGDMGISIKEFLSTPPQEWF